jgi:tRNA uridine 5-carboxymethylaminomethyl modification enzyme
MFTSRAEYRLLLREDNADLRLTTTGRELGLVSENHWREFSLKREAIENETDRLAKVLVRPDDLSSTQQTWVGGSLRREQKALELLKRPEIDYSMLTEITVVGQRRKNVVEYAELSESIENQIEIQARYEGYLERQEQEIERARRHSETELPGSIDYTNVRGLSHEIRQKLTQIRPATVGQATRISGMTPAAVSLLLVHLKKQSSKSA